MRNPISQVPGYRHQLVNQMKDLKALDEYIITDEEKMSYLSPNAIRFRAMSPQFMKIYVPKFLENQSADKHVFNLEVDIYRIKRLFERNSPSIRIQSIYRGYNYRGKAVFSFSQKKQAAIKIQKVVRGWLYRRKIKKELRNLLKQNGVDYLIMSQDEYRQYRAVGLIERSIHKWIRRKRKERLHNYSATMIQKIWKGKHMKHNSFLQAMEINKEHHRIYFLKEQKQEFYNILKEALEHNKWLSQKYNIEILKRFIDQDDNFQIIRYPNPLTFKRNNIPLIQHCEPSYQCRVKVNNGLSKLLKDGQNVHNLYTRFSGMEHEKEVLSKIKIRMCHYNSNDTNLIFQNGQNRVQTLRMRKLFDNYQELLVFQPPSLEVAKIVCQQIFWNNLDITNENFLVFFPNLMRRVSAATFIQQSFRSFLIRKEQKMQLSKKKRILIYPPIEYSFAQAVIQKRASYCIQKWWKYHKLKRRLEMLSHIHNFIKTINQTTLYIEETIYLNLSKILTNQRQKMRVIDQQLEFDFYHPSLAQQQQQNIQNQNNSNNIMTQTQRRMITESCNGSYTARDSIQSEGLDDLGYHIVLINYANKTERFLQKPLPYWVLKDIPDFHKYSYQPDQQTQFYNNYLGIVHKSSIDQMSVVKDYNEIVSHHNKQLDLNYGLSFIQINCCSVGEARKRAMVLALLSYDIKNRNFIRMYTQTSLTDGIFLKGLFQIWDQHGFKQADQKMHQLINKGNNNAAQIQSLRDKQKVQCHQGIGLTIKDRWEVEGNHVMRFYNIQKHIDIPTHYTTKQRNNEMQKVEYLYLQNIDCNEDPIKLQININGAQYEPLTPNSNNADGTLTSAQQQVKQQSQVSLQQVQKINGIIPSHYHITSKEPVSILKNITLLNNPKDVAIKLQQSNQYNINDVIQAPTSTKSVTAQPSSRYHQKSHRFSKHGSIEQTKNSVDQPTPTQILNSKYHQYQNQGSLVNFFNARNTSQVPSTKVNSNEQTPMHSSIITSGQQQFGSLPRSKLNNYQSQAFSAFISRTGSINQSLVVGESDNARLLDMKKFEDEIQREKLREQQQYEKMGKKFEVDKVKQINQIMKQIVKVEQDANIEMYRRFNKQEKELINELKDKERERLDKEQQLRRQMVLSHHNQKRRKQSEREFANEFNQIRNLISKQSKIGHAMKTKQKNIKQKQELVRSIRGDEDSVILNNKSNGNLSQHRLKPLISTVFDSSHILEPVNKNYQRIPMTAISSPRVKNDFMQNQKVHINSSHKLIENYYYQGKRYPSNGTSGIQQQAIGSNSDFDQIENKLYEFGLKQTAKNNLIKYRQNHKMTFIEENYPINSQYL